MYQLIQLIAFDLVNGRFILNPVPPSLYQFLSFEMIHRWSTVTPSSGQIVSLSQSITNNARASATRHSQRTYSTLTRPHIRPPHQAAVSSRAVPSSAYTNLTRTSSSANSIPTTAAASLTRSFTTSRRLNGLEEFFVNNTAGDVGNAWTPAQLRLKSFEDLQKLWFVLLKERNMLHTYKRQCKGLGEPMQGPERIAKVRESMRGIKIVMGERYREYKAASQYTPISTFNTTDRSIHSVHRRQPDD